MSEGQYLRRIGAAAAVFVIGLALSYKADRLLNSAEAEILGVNDSMPNGVWTPPYVPPSVPTYVVVVPPPPVASPVFTVVVSVPSIPPRNSTTTLTSLPPSTYIPPTMPSIPPTTVLTSLPPTVPSIPPTTALTSLPPTVPSAVPTVIPPTVPTPLPTFSALEVVEALAYAGDADCIIDHAMAQDLGVRDIANPDVLNNLMTQCAAEHP